MAEAGETAACTNSASDDLQRKISTLEVELSEVKSAIALEERLAKLDKAVFGGEPTSGLSAVRKRMTMAAPLAIGAPSGFGLLDGADGRWRS